MKRILLTALTILIVLSLNARSSVVFEIKDGLYDMPLKARMEAQVSSLLTAINSAAEQGGDVIFSGIDIDDMASFSVASLWSNVHFRTFDEEIVTSALTLKSGGNIRGYQVRGIEIEMLPIDDTFKDDLAQEVCIDFDKSGKIIDFNLAIGVNQYLRLFREGVELDDLDQRLQILNYVQQFKNAYNTKNIKFMEDIFSEDALIITGKVIKRVKSDIPLPPEIQYTKYNKQQYLNNLRKVFARNGYININFSDIRIRRHGAKPNYYGVTLKQDWNSSTYSDEGILFLIWDFTDEDAPKIHVRTWQPLEDQKVFSLSDFKLP